MSVLILRVIVFVGTLLQVGSRNRKGPDPGVLRKRRSLINTACWQDQNAAWLAWLARS